MKITLDMLIDLARNHGFSVDTVEIALDIARESELDDDDYWENRGPLALLEATAAEKALEPHEAAYRAFAAKKKQLVEADEWIRINQDGLNDLPHPQWWRARGGETLLDHLRWFWANAGTSDKLEAYRTAVKALEGN